MPSVLMLLLVVCRSWFYFHIECVTQLITWSFCASAAMVCVCRSLFDIINGGLGGRLDDGRPWVDLFFQKSLLTIPASVYLSLELVSHSGAQATHPQQGWSGRCVNNRGTTKALYPKRSICRYAIFQWHFFPKKGQRDGCCNVGLSHFYNGQSSKRQKKVIVFKIFNVKRGAKRSNIFL